MLDGFHHVAVICSDYPTSKAFYTETLGFTVLDENYREARDSYKCDLVLPDGSQIELFSFPGAPARPSRPEAQGLRHLAFRVQDIDAAVTTLTSKQSVRIFAQTLTPASALPFFRTLTVCPLSYTR